MLLALTLVAIGSIALAVAVIAIIGAQLPASHHVASRIRLAASPDTVWALVSRLERWPEWNPACRGMTRGPDRDGQPFWTMKSSFGDLPMLVAQLEPPHRLVTRISPADGSRLPFEGTWSYLVQPDGDGCMLTIHEHGRISNLVFRGLARYVFGHHSSLDRTLQGLATHLELDAVPEHLPIERSP